MSMSRPVQDWPLILTGPILRRVEPGLVSVFVALSRPCKVVLEIYNKLSPGTFDTPNQSRSHDTTPLGKNLHVCLVQWRGVPDLAPATIYGYDLRFEEVKSTGSTFTRLADWGLLQGPYKLGYEEKLPSFSLPPGLKDLNIIHGSCRKVHAPGADALAILDDLIKNDYTSPLKRPHQLLLTGDQIYADDVPVCLLATLMETANTLLSWSHDEQITVSTSATTIGPQDDTVVPGVRRGDFINNKTTFTSGIKEKSLVDGHLIFLGEFYAMYLIAWSDALWPRSLLGGDNPYTLPTAEDLLLNWGSTLFLDEKNYLSKLNGQRAAALEFARTLPQVRRALANVPTYMMLDDHEVTDDWNIYRQWDTRARTNPPGKQIIRNALLAYAVFQDWGNHPENYAQNALGKQLLDAITCSQSGSLPPIESQPQMADVLLDIQPHQRTPLVQRMRWDWEYSLVGGEHQIIALDTRTWRSYPTTAKGNAALITSDPTKNDAELVAGGIPLGFQLVAHKPVDDRLAIIISPAPVIGHPLVELLQKFAVRDPKTGPEEADNEAWSGDRVAFEDLLKRLTAFKRCILLSGDVHYAFSNQLAYFRKGWPSAQSARIIQFCSSALKNESEQTNRVGDAGYAYVPKKLGWLGFDRNLISLRDDLKTALDTGIGSDFNTDPALARDNALFFFMIEVNDRFTKPAVIPSGRYTKEQAYQLVRDTARDATTQADLTDWRYTVTYLIDQRSVTAREANVTDLQALLGSDPKLKHYHRMLIHSQRDVVGKNNLGQLRFSSQGGTASDQVTHRIHWQVPAPTNKDQQVHILMFTEHTASLTMPTTIEWPEVTK